MDKRHTHREENILEEAFAALRRTTGIEAQIIKRCDTPAAGDALIEIKTTTKKYKFLADVKTVRHFATIGVVKGATRSSGLRGLSSPGRSLYHSSIGRTLPRIASSIS